MNLKSIEYSENVKMPTKWVLEEMILGKINLIIGKNATGKTRVLNIITNLARLVTSDENLNYPSGKYKVTFEKNRKKTVYVLEYEDKTISKEELIVEGKKLLSRGEKGVGSIYFEKMKKKMKFQVPDNKLACVSRRDSVQHPFFEELYNWGKKTILYYFGTDLGGSTYAVFSKKEKTQELNLKETEKVVSFFKHGVKNWGSKFTNTIKENMNNVGYRIDEVGIAPMAQLKFPDGTSPYGLYAKEADLKGETSQFIMSQGMFRVLSLLVQVTYSSLSKSTTCILIDDIGEGLDYDRSSLLIKLLIGKAEKANFQLIMSTNDRFVMNNVPLEYWSVLKREGYRCGALNIHNSKKIFEEFDYTGLSNFDFFSTDFYLNKLKK